MPKIVRKENVDSWLKVLMEVVDLECAYCHKKNIIFGNDRITEVHTILKGVDSKNFWTATRNDSIFFFCSEDHKSWWWEEKHA